MIGLGVAGLGLGVVVASSKKGSSRRSGSGGGSPVFIPPQSRGVPFATGAPRPMWPIQPRAGSRIVGDPERFAVSYKDVNNKWHGRASRAFKASRGSRWHAGIDVFADGEDFVLAPEDGVIVARIGFYEGTGAMIIQTDTGVNVLLGEIKMGGAKEFGLDVGSRVKRGQRVSRVWWHDTDPNTPGIQGGAHMLHFETYRPGTLQNHRWYKGSSAPASLLDPTAYLLRARASVVSVA